MIYRFKMITGRKDGFFREYEIEDNNTLYDFHRLIQNDSDFDEAQMAAFYTSNTSWEKHKQFALFDMGDGAMDTIIIEDLIRKKIKFLVYTFDFFNNRSFLIEFIGETEPERRTSYPNVADGKGQPPNQLVDRPLPEPLPIDDIPKKNSKSTAIDDVIDDEDEDDDYDDENDNDNNDDSFDIDDLDMLSETKEV